jgi:signal transduction histidine kinase
MVLLAMLVPLAVLLRSYALEDRLSRAALEAQATETVVSGNDKGAVATYLDQINRDQDVTTTVLYPPSSLHPDGEAVGPSPGEDADVAEARTTGQASVRDVDGGSEILVPVSLGGSTAAPEDTPVIRIEVRAPGLESDIVRSWFVLFVLGAVLLCGALLLADRIGRSFVQPIHQLATYATTLGDRQRPRPVTPSGPGEVRELASVMNRLVFRIDALLERERAGVADVSHRLRTPMTALRLRIEALTDADQRERLEDDLDELQATVDHIVREARRSEREGVAPSTDAVSAILDRVRFWEPLAEDQGRQFELHVGTQGPVHVRSSEHDVRAVVDVLLDNVFTYTPDGAAVVITMMERADGGLDLVVEDAGPGLPGDLEVIDRGASGIGSTGLGLAIADKTATASGGGLSLGASRLGGARVVVGFGPVA